MKEEEIVDLDTLYKEYVLDEDIDNQKTKMEEVEEESYETEYIYHLKQTNNTVLSELYGYLSPGRG